MVSRCKYRNASEIEAYTRITSSYAILPSGTSERESFFSVFEKPLSEYIPVLSASITATSIIGRLCVGNSKGLLLPLVTTDHELQQIRDCLPDSVVVERVDEPFSALGNVISCNDYIAIHHPELDSETIEVIGDVLGVDAFPQIIGEESLVGTHSVFSNRGGVVFPPISPSEMEALAGQLSIELTVATVNRGQASP
jgi:translation initiation factor 6